MNASDRQDWGSLHFIALAALCALLYLPTLYLIPFFDKGEPREALEVQSIVMRGDWLFPLKFGEDIPSKPPLFHWAGAIASILWGGTNEFTVRFPSALFATFGVLLICALGRRLFDANVGIFAGVILATTFVYQKQAVEARVDMTLCFFVTATLVLFYAIYQGRITSALGFYGFYLVAGVAVLAKGPVGLILPAVTVAVFLAIRKRWDWFSRLCFHKGVLLALAVGFVWYGIAVLQGGEEFVGRQIFKENLARFFVRGEGGTGHQKPLFYYIPYLFLQGLPWTLFLPFVIVHWVQEKSWREEKTLFLGLWIAVDFGFFSLAAGKRAVYILPLYPALALLTAQWLLQERKVDRAMKTGLRLLGGLCILSALVSGVVLFWSLEGRIPPRLARLFGSRAGGDEFKLVDAVFGSRGLGLRLFLGAAVLLWFLAGWRFFGLQVRRGARILALTSAVTWSTIQLVFVPAIAFARSYGPFMRAVNKEVARGGRLYVYYGDFDNSSVIFYHGGPIPELKIGPAALIARLKLGDDHVLMNESEWHKIQSLGGTLNVDVIRSEGDGPEGGARLVLVSRAAPHP